MRGLTWSTYVHLQRPMSAEDFDDAGHDDENAEDLYPATDDPDRVIDYRFSVS